MELPSASKEILRRNRYDKWRRRHRFVRPCQRKAGGWEKLETLCTEARRVSSLVLLLLGRRIKSILRSIFQHPMYPHSLERHGRTRIVLLAVCILLASVTVWYVFHAYDMLVPMWSFCLFVWFYGCAWVISASAHCSHRTFTLVYFHVCPMIPLFQRY